MAVLTFLEFSGSIHFKEILSKDQNTQYIVVVLYTIIPPFLFWSILKMLTMSTHAKEKNEDFLSIALERTLPIERFLFRLEHKLVTEVENYERIMKRGDFYGKLFALFSLIIPGVSWGYVFMSAAYTQQPPSLGLFGFSSMMAGGMVGVTITITMLRHSKTAQPYIEKINSEIIHIRKLRIVCLANPEPTLDNKIMLKVMEALLFNPREDFLKERKEEDAINSSALSIVSSILEERDK